MLYVIASLNIKAGTRDKVAAAAARCVAATRAEDGCVSYDLNVDIADDTRLVIVERWRDRAALEAHFKTPHLQAWRAASTPFVESRRVEIIEDGKVEVL